MKTRLWLCISKSVESDFNHLVSDDIDLDIGDILDYNDYYTDLDEDAVKAFAFLKLSLGNYRVIKIWYSKEDRNEKVRNILLQAL
ncbi:hypothetical protein [Chryseobacterium indologenes]|uniref:hypothetical protein n=1 Tax=Chryseobacterium indologenes TaxID=253 RepID=UPI000B2A22BC|nr:hypothetical protein [Chryseobacterium indologenes]